MEFPYLQFAVSLDLRKDAFPPDQPAFMVAKILSTLAQSIHDKPTDFFPAEGLSCAQFFVIFDSKGAQVGTARVS